LDSGHLYSGSGSGSGCLDRWTTGGRGGGPGTHGMLMGERNWPRQTIVAWRVTVKFVIISSEHAFDRQSINGITSVDSAYK